MALKITWTPQAQKGFDKILSYLVENWTEREVKQFVHEMFDFIEKLSHYPYLLRESSSRKLRRGPINKYTILTYRVKPRKNEIQLLNIRGSKQKPLR